MPARLKIDSVTLSFEATKLHSNAEGLFHTGVTTATARVLTKNVVKSSYHCLLTLMQLLTLSVKTTCSHKCTGDK